MRNINWIMDLAQELDPYFLKYEPRKHSMVEILGGILWILVSGAQWCLLPREIFPPKSTCYYWFNKFRKDRVLDMIMNKLNISDLKIVDEAYIDATFTEAKQGGLKVGGTKAGKGSKIFAVISKEKKVLHLSIENASPHEALFVPSIITDINKKTKVLNLIGDKAYDSFPLKETAMKMGVQMISPDRINRIHNKQDGRRLRRYKRRHRVENFFADLQTYRRAVTRYEKIPENHLNFLKLAVICLNVTKYNEYQVKAA